MKTWNDYKKEAKERNSDVEKDISEIESLVEMISVIIAKRNELGYSQRELAEKCGLPQSSIARIESCAVFPNFETLFKIMQPLGLKISLTTI